jgi:tRNA-dihydrouridine synthase A
MRCFDDEDWRLLTVFVRALVDAGAAHLIVHARKAVLGRFSPKDNREVPPLRYDAVERLAGEFPELTFTLNGGLRTLDQVADNLRWADSVMLGREAYHRPQLLAELGQGLLAETPRTTADMLARMQDYAAAECARGTRLAAITRHLLGWFAGQDGSREFRRLLSEGAREAGASPQLIAQAAAAVRLAS